MTKKQLLNAIESFDNEAVLVFSEDTRDFLSIDSDGLEVSSVLEVNTGTKKFIVFSVSGR